jgi:bifunctional UDP-N-acetylglucosamine pyrophosphorylase/glucosamine-1-phosphate N-acetyltransferase
MFSGVTIVDPQTTFIAADVKIGRDATIWPFTVIENDVRIGQRCHIGPFCRLRPGTELADDVEVGNFTEISRSRLGQMSLMKHFSFLGDARVGSRVNIGAGTVTANFDGKRKNRTTILDEAFIGSDSILVAPVQVGRRAATAAGAVVTKGQSIPPGYVAMGVPAKVISTRKF